MHVLSHTHWDREWYQDFQGFRQRLVFQVDMLMDLLEKRAEYRYFHMDGQTIWIKDYLQIRPEMKERLTKHLQSGRILIGPWYVMPDELLLSGESLVRNLMLGHRICREFGVKPMPVGYVSDIFGHCSQFPQIVRGFGLDAVFLHRGITNADDASEMLWEGADGSEVLMVVAYPHTGYNDFMAYRGADEETLLDYEEKKKAYAATSVLFALEGNDHAPAYWDTPERIERINSIFKDINCVHSSMNDYLRDLKEELAGLPQDSLKRYEGELRHPMKDGMYAELFYGTASARVNLKQQNDALEYLLGRTVEPLHAFSVILGGDSQKPFLDLAWEYLITNHPHDSIVGCSIDQVHRDMIYRFDQARLLAKNSVGESLMAIGDAIDTASLGESHAVVTVYNPSSVESSPVTEFSFEVLSKTVDEKRKQGLVPALFDEDGNQVYIEEVDTELDMCSDPQARKVYGDSPSYFRIPAAWHPHHRFRIAAAGSIPALGYKSYAIRFTSKRSGNIPGKLQPVKVDQAQKTLENEYIRLTAREDGLIDILDKLTGVSYQRLHDLEDCGDAGSGWDHVYPEFDKVVKASDPGAKGPVEVRLEQSGKLKASVLISYSLNVPKALTSDRKSRSEEKVLVPVRTSLTLTSGSRRVDVKTTIHNTAKSHRLRVLFPTGRKTGTWFGDSAFDLVERNIKLPDTTGWKEQAREEAPIKNLTAVQDDKGGFAVITKGLCEVAVQDNPETTLALTLFRGFEQQIGDGWTKDSQMPGELEFEYSLVPFTPAAGVPSHLFEEVERYKVRAVSLTSSSHPGKLPPSAQFIDIPDGLVVSTIKLAEDGEGMIIRLFNPSEREIIGDIKLMLPVRGVWRTDLLESEEERLDLNNSGAVTVRVGAKKITTFRLSTGYTPAV